MSIDKRIIYLNEDDKLESDVSIVIPSTEGLEDSTIDELAKKLVPTGKKYKIVDKSEISNDRTFRNAWTIAESELTDGVGE
jgi:hypothetical protein